MKVTLGIVLLAVCIAFGSATRCDTTFDKGTQTPRLWRWPEYSLRRWPHQWSLIPTLTFPFNTGQTDLDRMFDDFFADPWQSAIEGPSETDRHGETDNQQSCGCPEKLSHTRDQSRQGEELEEYPRFESSPIHSQQMERNTQRNHQTEREPRNDFVNHQHELRRQHQQRRPDHSVHDHMGRHPSNQQPMDQRHSSRQMRHKSQAEMHTSDEARVNFPRDPHTRDAHIDPERRFTDIHNLPRNRDNRTPPNRNTPQHHMTQPVNVYSTQVQGYRPSEVQVKTEGKTLKVQGRRVCGCQEPCTVREFERVFTLPEGVDTRNLQATLNKDGTLSVQSKVNHRLSRGHFENRDILVEGLDLPPIEDSSTNTENCVKKVGFKLGKMNKRTGETIPATRHHDEVSQRMPENEMYDDGVTIEVVDENF